METRPCALRVDLTNKKSSCQTRAKRMIRVIKKLHRFLASSKHRYTVTSALQGPKLRFASSCIVYEYENDMVLCLRGKCDFWGKYEVRAPVGIILN